MPDTIRIHNHGFIHTTGAFDGSGCYYHIPEDDSRFYPLDCALDLSRAQKAAIALLAFLSSCGIMFALAHLCELVARRW